MGRERVNWAYEPQRKLTTGGKVEFPKPQAVQILFIRLVAYSVYSVYCFQQKAVDGVNLYSCFI